MAIFGIDKAGKDAGIEAAKEVHATVDDALHTVDSETIPTAKAAAESIVLQAVNGLYAIVVDLMNRSNGAELPVDITIQIHGKIGPLKLNLPVEMTATSVEVQG